jgi:hypothetical protein
MKVKTTAHIYFAQYAWEKEAKYQIYPFKIDDTEHLTHVSTQKIEIEVPDNYDPRAQKIAALESQKNKVMADFQKTVNEINERISKLQAIEYTAQGQ